MDEPSTPGRIKDVAEYSARYLQQGLPSGRRCGLEDESPVSTRKYLAYFMHRHLSFRLEEVEALASMFGITQPLRWSPPASGNELTPFWYVWLPDDRKARQISSRALLLKGFLEIWGEGGTLEELEDDIRQNMPPPESPYFSVDSTWKIIMDGWGSAISNFEELHRRLAFVPFRGRVCLTAPDHRFRLIRASTDANTGLPSHPMRWFFCRQVAMVDKKICSKYMLPGRRYLGPTSMDAEMAAIMANQAQVKRGSLVLDPFVGTGSMLIAAAAVGAATVGSDIDMRIIRLGKTDAKGRHVDLWTNFDDYRLPPPVGLMRGDAHLMPWRSGMEEMFDAIVADPPYGVRAGGRKSQWKEYVARPEGRPHFTSTAPYALAECLADLLDTAARLLVVGGRLVYFLPIVPTLYSEADVPRHPCLLTLANSEQILSGVYSRRLITMVKRSVFDSAASATHRATAVTATNIDQLADHAYKQHRSPLDEAERLRHRFRSKCV